MAKSNSGISGTIDLNGNLPPEKVVDITGKVHQLPCCVKFNGPSDVSHYFKPKSTGIVILFMQVKFMLYLNFGFWVLKLSFGRNFCSVFEFVNEMKV